MTEKTCECHGEAMRFQLDDRYRAGGFWTCRAQQRAREQRRYERMSGLAYNRKLLMQRRRKALARQRRRTDSGECDGALQDQG